MEEDLYTHLPGGPIPEDPNVKPKWMQDCLNQIKSIK
jgi:hypothetical protein